MNKKEILEIVKILTEVYPDSTPALKYTTPFELLVAVILSAQCTDERVNKVTEVLFKRANQPIEFAQMEHEELEKYIYSCGFYRAKASHIISSAKDIVEKFDGQVPATLEQLQTLAGVGRKTANVVYSVAFGGDAIAVDTHVFRVSNRIGLAKAKTPLDTENQLMQALPKEKWSHLHHALIFHGRRVCSSRKPKCRECELRQYCKYKDKKVD
jgi:endonuclease-3